MKYPFLRGILAAEDVSDQQSDSPKPEHKFIRRATLRSGIHKIKVLKRHECASSDEFIYFWDASSVYRFLRKLTHKPSNMRVLRNVLNETSLIATTSISRLNDDKILQQLAGKIARGEIRLVPQKDEARRIAIMGRALETAMAEDAAEAPAMREEPVAAATQSAPPVVEESAVETPPAEAEVELELGAEIEEPFIFELEIEIEEPLTLELESEIEEPPTLELEFEIEEPPILELEFEIEEPPVLELEFEIEEPPTLELESEIEEPPTLELESEIEEPPTLELESEIEELPTLELESEIEELPTLELGVEI